MLYMLVVTHSPELCPMANKTVREKYLSYSKQMPEIAKSLGVTIQDGWTNELTHTSYQLVDAPNAHVIVQCLSKVHLLEWTRVDVNPVYTRQEIAAQLQKVT